MIEDELAVMVSFFYYRVGFRTVDDQLANGHDNYGNSNADSSISFQVNIVITSRG